MLLHENSWPRHSGRASFAQEFVIQSRVHPRTCAGGSEWSNETKKGQSNCQLFTGVNP